MIKYCKILNEQTGLVQLGVGCSNEYYEEIGMVQRDVEQSEKDNQWYLSEKCPHYTPEEKEQQEKQKRNQEINSKIYQLREMSLIDIMNNNKENIQIYNDVISGLEMSRPLI